MSDLSINPVYSVDYYSIHKVLSSSLLSDAQKVNFLQRNADEVKSIMKLSLSSAEYTMIVQNRPLLSFKPIRNAFTHRGDKILLAEALGIPEDRINLYIKKATTDMQNIGNVDFMTDDQLKSLTTYVYRHGTQGQLCTFFNYELSKSNNIINSLHKNLEFNRCGVADYFTRPIHRMGEKTLLKLFSIINKNLINSVSNGKISEKEATQTACWALQQLYIMQNNSMLIKRKSTTNK